jgi:N-glycosidase YbiA
MSDAKPKAVINFYSTAGEYGCFSNFSRHSIFLKAKRWPTSEHYFQAQKFAGEPDEEEIRKAAKPSQAAGMGRDRKRPLRRDWESVKEQVMLDALRAKFTQHEELKAVLLGTGDAVLVEHTANDSYWGDGGDGSGKNRLGHLLMKVREELRAQSEQPPAKAGG